MIKKPILSPAVTTLTAKINAMDERGEMSQIQIPVEHALTVYLDEWELVTLMTMGAYPEALVLGYLHNQGLIRSIEEIASVQVDWDTGTARVGTHHAVKVAEEITMQRIVTTGCGQGTVFSKVMTAMRPIIPVGEVNLSQRIAYAIVETIRSQQAIYKQARAVHACALFSSQGELLYFVEDIGRHNAVDTIAGFMCLNKMDGNHTIFYTTGRLTSEMVMKGAQMRIPFLLSRSGATQMGCQIAQNASMSLLTRCTGKHFLILTHFEQVLFDAVE